MTTSTKNKVRDWMTPNPITIDAGASVVEAIHLLKEKNIRRLPVVKGGKLVGLVTERMLLSFSPGKSTSLDTWEVHYLLAKTPVTQAMNPKPNTVTPDTDLADCAQLIHDRKLNGITVVEPSGSLVGILTTTNALEALIWFTKQAQQAANGKK
jgi:acetoin utilization protein AcuB